MRRRSVDDVDPTPYDEALHADRRELSEPLGTSSLAIVRYRLEPGERLSGSLHAHPDQEEVFVVFDGEVTFRTREACGDRTNDSVATERAVTVATGEAIRFAPGEFQTGRNDADEPAVVLGPGAPRTSDDVRIARIPVRGDVDVSCPDCGLDHMRMQAGDGPEFVCPDCGAESSVE